MNRFGDIYENTIATTDGGSDEDDNRSRFSSMVNSSVGEDLPGCRRMAVILNYFKTCQNTDFREGKRLI